MHKLKFMILAIIHSTKEFVNKRLTVETVKMVTFLLYSFISIHSFKFKYNGLVTN
jgi:hypothetical protein